MRKLILVSASFFALILTFTRVEAVFACSGGGPPPGHFAANYLLSLDTALLVAGRINSLSESGINAVLNIDYYLRGDGEDTFLLLSRESVERLELFDNGRPYPVRCISMSSPLQNNALFIASLWQSDNGSYYGYFLTADSDNMFTVYELERPDEPIVMDYEEVIAYFVERIGESPRIPQRRVMPRATSIQLNGSAGNYMLPVDQDNLSSIETDIDLPTTCHPYINAICLAQIVALNNLDTAYFYAPETQIDSIINVDRQYELTLVGETGVFSPNSDLIAVWQENEIRVFTTSAQIGLAIDYYTGPAEVAGFNGSSVDPLITGGGAWSPNGRTFAFSTESGVWFWDVLLPESEPELFLSADDQPIRVRHFSPQGNYIALETDDQRYHIDLLSGQEYPDGLFSPNDRMLAAYDTAADSLTPLRLFNVLPEFLPRPGWANYSVDISQFEWVDADTYIYAACGDPILDVELEGGFDQPWCKVRTDQFGRNESTYVDGISFDYDPVTHSLATLIDGDTITLNGEVFDFEGQFPEGITEIELTPLIDLDHRRF